MSLAGIQSELKKASTPERAKSNAWFFKTGKGQYGHGDKFLGVTVPEQRKIARKYRQLPLTGVEQLIMSSWHEERLTGLFILVDQYQRADELNKKQIYNFYMSHTKHINNWDLVDSSAGYIVGDWLRNKMNKMLVLRRLASSKLLWDRRIAMISTFAFIHDGSAGEALEIAEKLLNDEHDLIQKAVGWMLREVGKRAGNENLIKFLNKHAATMPRTTLRYSIEHFDDELRKKYLNMHLANSGDKPRKVVQ